MTEEGSRSVVRRERFSDGPARAFLSSMAADERIFAADLAVDRAHTIMLAEQAIVDEAVAADILDALETIEGEGYDALPEAEDVHEAIETRVIKEVGAAGGAMHTARSRNDEVATCIRYQLRVDVLSTLEAVVSLRDALAGVATDHIESVMPGYTHLQPAQPITVAHWACSYERALARDTSRLLDAYDRVNQSPLGGGAFAGTTFPIDRARTAELLGFDGVVTNAMDAAATRDVPAEVLGDVAILGTTLSGLAEDVVLFAHREFVELDDDYASTSSIMPQKKNPDSMELVRGIAGDAAGGFTGLLTTLKGLPRAYNRDLQRATPHLWRTLDAVAEGARVSAGALDTADWNEGAMDAAAGEGFSTATSVADLLATSGLPFRVAHEVVATAASESDEEPVPALERAANELLEADLWAYVTEDELAAAMDPVGSVESRDSLGGPAPAAVENQLTDIRDALRADSDVIETHRDRLGETQALLGQEVGKRV